MPGENYWDVKSLAEMTPAEWESLCDGCARCCLHKLEDKDTGEVSYTSVACRLLDLHECNCRVYEHRMEIIPDCMTLTPAIVSECSWLPSTCAYRRIHEGNPLSWWHPLISGSRETVHDAGISLRHKAISEIYVDVEDLEAYIIADDTDTEAEGLAPSEKKARQAPFQMNDAKKSLTAGPRSSAPAE